jgi:hypothetical protein
MPAMQVLEYECERTRGGREGMVWIRGHPLDVEQKQENVAVHICINTKQTGPLATHLLETGDKYVDNFTITK